MERVVAVLFLCLALFVASISLGSGYENTVTVSSEGGDFTTIAAALAYITDAGENNRYLVQVYPGTYTVTSIETKPYVDLVGIDLDTCTIVSGSMYSAVLLASHSRLSNVTVKQTGGTAPVSFVEEATSARVDHCRIVGELWAIGGALHWSNSEISYNRLEAPNPIWMHGADRVICQYNTCEYSSSAAASCIGAIDSTGFDTGARNCVFSHNNFRIVHTGTDDGFAYGVFLTRGGNTITNNVIDITTTRAEIDGIIVAEDQNPEATANYISGNTIRMRTTHASPVRTVRVSYCATGSVDLPTSIMAGNTIIMEHDNALSDGEYGTVVAPDGGLGSLDLSTDTDVQGVSQPVVTVTYSMP
jgi:hypothetical protein